jgi:hypothetical protein
MRHLLPLALIASLAVGCTDRSAPPEAQGRPQRDHPLAQDGSAARAITSTPDRVRVQVDLAAVRAAVQAYHGEHAAWPRSLDELSMEGRLNYPADLTYDAATGTVTSQTYPSL